MDMAVKLVNEDESVEGAERMNTMSNRLRFEMCFHIQKGQKSSGSFTNNFNLVNKFGLVYFRCIFK
jgi:hypothetical protein